MVRMDCLTGFKVLGAWANWDPWARGVGRWIDWPDLGGIDTVCD